MKFLKAVTDPESAAGQLLKRMKHKEERLQREEKKKEKIMKKRLKEVVLRSSLMCVSSYISVLLRMLACSIPRHVFLIFFSLPLTSLHLRFLFMAPPIALSRRLRPITELLRTPLLTNICLQKNERDKINAERDVSLSLWLPFILSLYGNYAT